MFKHVIEAKHIGNYKIWISFNDGKKGNIDLSEKLSGKGGVFEPLKDISYFRKFGIANGTLTWENGADFAPESLYGLIHPQEG